MALKRLDKQQTLSNLPSEWAEDVMPNIRQVLAKQQRKLVVLDDDPTGTQTVYDIAVLTEWSVETLIQEFESESGIFYILTNSRGLSLVQAQALNHEIATNLKIASQETGQDFAVVSRSDSTLRGHFPSEVDALIGALQIDFDALLIIPFFIEGGRYTIHDIHYVAEDEYLIPAGETAFAKDKAFGYQSSNLKAWIEEKTGGRVSQHSVQSISLDDIRLGGPKRVTEKLMQLGQGTMCIVNAASIRDIQVFAYGLLLAETQGKRFIYRTAASFVQARAGLTPQPFLNADDLNLSATGGGLIVVGSYVPKTTQQLKALLTQTDVQSIEIDVNALLNEASRQQTIGSLIQEVDSALKRKQDVVIYTSRDLITVEDGIGSLSIGQRISSGLIAILQGIQTQPRYILAKGGITSSDVATQALHVKKARVLGQILAGIPVWELGEESRFPKMPYIVFPGNVGDENALATVVQKLSKG